MLCVPNILPATTMTTNPDTRLEALESKLAFQEDLLASLNDALVDQQARIDILERATRLLVDTVTRLAPDEKPPEIDERPPHY